MKKKLKVCFIPTEENNHKPHFLRSGSIKALLLMTIISEALILSLILPGLPQKLNYLSAVLPSVLVSYANESREDLNLSSLNVNEKLQQAAQFKANDMAEKGYFSHYTPDGKSPWYFVNKAGYSYEFAGENLAVNFIDSDDVHEAWMDSPTHRANILRGEFTEIGIATAKGTYKGKNVIFVAQFFAKPKVNVNSGALTSSFLDTNKDEKEVVLIGNDQSEVRGIESGEEVAESENTPTNKVDIKDISIKDNFLANPISTISIIMYIFLGLAAVATLINFFVEIKVQDRRILTHGILIVIILVLLLYLNSELVRYIGETASIQ